jgi:hypothetical protein
MKKYFLKGTNPTSPGLFSKIENLYINFSFHQSKSLKVIIYKKNLYQKTILEH